MTRVLMTEAQLRQIEQVLEATDHVSPWMDRTVGDLATALRVAWRERDEARAEVERLKRLTDVAREIGRISLADERQRLRALAAAVERQRWWLKKLSGGKEICRALDALAESPEAPNA
jgi:hypothetical protein